MTYKRFFAFGCSFTEWPWTTWADIVAAVYPKAQYYNYGKKGASNQLILSRVMEADSVFNFNKDDLVIVQWTSITRESRFLVNSWRGAGNVYRDYENYGEDFYKYTDPIDYLIRDCAAIKSVHSLLTLKQCKFEFLSMVPLTDPQTLSKKKVNIDLLSNKHTEYLLQTYKPVLDFIKPSYLEVVYKGDFQNNDTRLVHSDGHPDPEQHLKYLEKVLPSVPITEEGRTLVHKDMDTLISLPRITEDNKAGGSSQSWRLAVEHLWIQSYFRAVGTTVPRNTSGLRF